MLDKVPGLVLQELNKQSDYKLSYYLPLKTDQASILTMVEHRLSQLDVNASLIYSVDDEKQMGLLDILPRNATKLHGIRYLHKHLGYDLQEVLFAGDSGNDLPVLGSSLRSVLVANALPEIQQQAILLARQNGNTDTLYIAGQHDFPLGGNYSAGVIQGVMHFMPEITDQLQLL